MPWEENFFFFCDGDNSSDDTSLWESLAKHSPSENVEHTSSQKRRLKALGRRMENWNHKISQAVLSLYCIYKLHMLFYIHPHYGPWPLDMWKKLNTGITCYCVYLNTGFPHHAVKKDIIHTQAFRQACFPSTILGDMWFLPSSSKFAF